MTDRPRPKGCWKPGQSGNPGGKPKGAGRQIAKLREGIAAHVPDIIARLVELAKAGDVSAAKLLIDRVCAPLRPGDDPVTLPDPAGSLAAQARSIMTAITTGRLTPTQGGELLTALGAVTRIVESTELAERVARLEAVAP